jgi:4-hydroxy 2-oxovalerate aldolase
MTKKIWVLDATLRDGGQGLDDLYHNGFADKVFTEERKHETIRHLENAGIEIIELGAMGPSKDDKSDFAIYQGVEELSQYLPAKRKPGCMYVGLYIGPDTEMDDIPEWNPSLVEGVRVILRYSELRKSLDYCAGLARKGYKVFVQPMLTARYTDEELDLIIRYSNEMGAFACYFVDSYGFMTSQDIRRLFEYYDARLRKDIKIGFHAHNNMNLAYANVQYFVGQKTERELIVDACATGMGQGAGNMQTELLLPYLNQAFSKDYVLDEVLEVCDYLDREMIPANLWGYSVTRLLPALYKTAYKYALIMRNKYHMDFKEMNTVLREMPDELRNRYTPQNLETAMNILKGKK